MKLAWITDPHFNFLPPKDLEAFCVVLAETPADAFLITGDIGEAPDVLLYLDLLDSTLRRPIFFVLGNHDFYRGSIEGVREKVADLCDVSPRLHWLPNAGIVPLGQETCLLGHDGWADGRCGNFLGSDVRMSDWRLIEELVGLNPEARLKKLKALGDEAASFIRGLLPEALSRFQKILLATHVPPFPEGCLWKGKITSDNWLPHVCCKAVGDVLREAMRSHPDRQMEVLCGHTHQRADGQVLPNLRIMTGGAEYGRPVIQRVIEID